MNDTNDLRELNLPPKIQSLNFRVTPVTMFGVTAKHWSAVLEGERLRFVTFPCGSEYESLVSVFFGGLQGAVKRDYFVDYLWQHFG